MGKRLMLWLGRTCKAGHAFQTRDSAISLEQDGGDSLTSIACGRRLVGAHVVYRNLLRGAPCSNKESTNPTTRGDRRVLGKVN
jgi:hypothetical protein